MSRPKTLKTGCTEAQVLAQVLEAVRMLGLDIQRRNTGAALNPRGQLVRFGEPGDPDLSGVLPDGRAVMIEVKREGWSPARARGKEAERWKRQLDRLRQTNARGGVAFFVDDAEVFLKVMRAVLDGARVVEYGDRLEVILQGREKPHG